MEFKVGDVVEAYGVVGTIMSAGLDSGFYGRQRMRVDFETGNSDFFYSDGREYNWHKEPALKLIARKKNLVKKIFYIGVGKNPVGPIPTTFAHISKIDAQSDMLDGVVYELEIQVEE